MHMGEMGGALNSFDGKPDGERPLQRLRHRWEDNIEMNVKGIDLEDVE